ncbi:MAG: SurA N-terminal domain-containing protein [Deltaproteobacteria bacterium]|nr:SurA N-terminal domain-containing protein [Deltaproteobacteria bacterium]
MRKHSRSSFIKIIFWMIIVVFVFWGVGVMVAGGDKVNVAATVDGEPISVQTYARAHERMQQIYRELYKENLSPQLLAQMNLGQRALDDLVTEMLLKREAGRLGLQVTDDEVREAILDIPAFRDGARFDRTRYLNTLRASRLTPTEFEESQREALLVNKLEGLLTDGITVSDQEVKDLYALENEKVDITFVKVPFAPFKDGVTVGDGEVAEYYEKNKERFRKPETVRIQYVTYAPEHFAEKVPVEEPSIKDYYEAHVSDYEQPERLHLQHILFLVPPGSDDAAKNAIKDKAAAVLASARTGDKAAFTELAKKNSEDAMSVENGGDLGVVARGQLEAPLEDAAFTLNVGEVSDLVESSRGYHIIRLDEKVPGGPKPFEDVREEIVKELRARGAEDAARSALAADLEKARAGTSLEDLAAAHGLEATLSKPVSRGQIIPGVKGPTMINTALVLEPGAVDQVMDAEPPFYLFKVNEKVASTIPPLDDVRTGIVEALTREKTKEAARVAAEALLEATRKAGGVAALAAEAQAKGYAVDTTGPFSRSEAIPKLAPAPIRDEVFALSTVNPLGAKPFIAPDAAIVLALKERIPADESGLTDEKKQALRDQTAARKRQEVLESYRNELRERAEITVNPDVMARTS